MDGVLDVDFHPDEPDARVFAIEPAGVVRIDAGVVVTEARYGGVVLRHYAFTDRWFKINVTATLDGSVVETGAAVQRFAFNCDIATPMEREGMEVFAVDLFVDVLVRSDGATFSVVDEDELGDALARGLVSASEARQARRATGELIDLVARGRLHPWLGEIAPLEPWEHPPPEAAPMRRAPVPDRLQAGLRPSW